MAKEVVGFVDRVSADGRTAYVVRVVRKPHALYRKIRAKRVVYCAETFGVAHAIGSHVVIVETRPWSGTKRWALKSNV